MPLNSPWLTPPQVAKSLGVKSAKIRHWIATGELPAVDLGDGSRPRWRISDSDLAIFLAGRRNRAPAPKVTQRRRCSPDVIEFF